MLFRVLAFTFCCLCASAADAGLGPGWERFYNLEYDQALAIFQRAAKDSPGDPDLQNHVAQTILYRDMLRAGALESELVSGNNPFLRRPKMQTTDESAREFDGAVNRAMEMATQRVEKDPNDIAAHYALGVSHGLRANYNFLVRKAWMDALRDATTARKHHQKATELDPKFTDARLLLGAHDYLVGSLPWGYKLLGFLAGIRGDREKGIETLRMVAEKGTMNRYDAKIVLAAIYRRERRAKEAVPLLHELIARFPRNYLFRLELAQMFGDLGDKTQALAAIAQVEEMKRANSTGYASLPMEKIWYYRGNLLFWYNDLDPALEQLTKVAKKADELDLNTGVMAWLRIGQIHDMKGRRAQAVDAYRHAIEVAPQSEAAKESRQYLRSAYNRV